MHALTSELIAAVPKVIQKQRFTKHGAFRPYQYASAAMDTAAAAARKPTRTRPRGGAPALPNDEREALTGELGRVRDRRPAPDGVRDRLVLLRAPALQERAGDASRADPARAELGRGRRGQAQVPEVDGLPGVVAVESPREREDPGVEEGQVVDVPGGARGVVQRRRDGVPGGPAGAVNVLEPAGAAAQELDGERGHVAHRVHGGVARLHLPVHLDAALLHDQLAFEERRVRARPDANHDHVGR